MTEEEVEMSKILLTLLAFFILHFEKKVKMAWIKSYFILMHNGALTQISPSKCTCLTPLLLLPTYCLFRTESADH